MTNVGSKRGHSKQKERIADAVHVFNAIGSNNPMVREVISPSPVRRTSPDLRRAITRSRVPPQPDRIIQTLRGTAASRPVSASNSESKKETSHQGYLQRVRMQCADDGLMRKGKDDRFFCQLCSMNYVRKKDCRTHIRKHHAIGASVDTTPSVCRPISIIHSLLFHTFSWPGRSF